MCSWQPRTVSRDFLFFIFYLRSRSPPESPAGSRTIEGDWKTSATRGCPAHRAGAVEVCRASWALTSCRLSSVTPPRTTRAAPPPLPQTLGKKYWHTQRGAISQRGVTGFSFFFGGGEDEGVSWSVGLDQQPPPSGGEKPAPLRKPVSWLAQNCI